jgi:DNA-binding response OmpR family regulator
LIVAVDGQDAVDKFRDNSDTIQLVVIDMVMPHKSGKQAYREMIQIKPSIRALFNSGYSTKIKELRDELAGSAEFIPKPVQPAVLLKKVREMLDRQRL